MPQLSSALSTWPGVAPSPAGQRLGEVLLDHAVADEAIDTPETTAVFLILFARLITVQDVLGGLSAAHDSRSFITWAGLKK